MNHLSGLSVPTFSDAVRVGTDVPSVQSVGRLLDIQLADGEEGTGTLHVDGDGVICACSRGAASLLGREPGELVGDVIWHIVPALEGRRLICESRADPHLAFLCHCGISFRVLHRSGATVPCRMFIHSVSDEGGPAALRLILRNDDHRPNICL